MRSNGVSVWRRAAWILGVACVGAAFLLATADPAEAARRRKKRYFSAYNPPAASMVVDAKTGRVLHASNPDSLRHPASITKVMTLYVLFEQLERGRYTLGSSLRVSANAASQAPSKLGLQPGDTIDVEDSIKALVTKSANDAAVVIAENIAGSEGAFAEIMTRKARALGMGRTVYANASGLPDADQVTTARDLITLGRAIQERFPKYYQYFATRSFEFNGASYRNHNRLLGRVEGVDGIKTGYTRGSGFNLLTSVKAGGRHIVAVVLGGRSGRSRDAQMASLVGGTMERAYAGVRIAPPVGETAVAAVERAEPIRVASAEPIRIEATHPRPPLRLAPFPTNDVVDLRPAPVTTASIAPPRPIARPADLANVRPVVASAVGPSTATPASAPRSVPKLLRDLAAADLPPAAATAYAPVRPGSNDALRPPGEVRHAAAVSHAARIGVATAPVRPAPAATTQIVKETASTASGWVIQLGATEDQGKAQEMLARAKAKSRVVAKASPFTEKITKGGATLWRARFAGFDSDEAQAACKALKRDGFNCFAARG